MEKHYSTFDIAAEVYDHKTDRGIVKHFRKYNTSRVEDLVIFDQDNIFHKETGRYVLVETLEDFDDDFSLVLNRMLKSIVKPYLKKTQKVLVAGLGNTDYSPDALGPRVAKKIKATMHIRRRGKQVAVCFPGVMAETGMETAEIVKALVDKNHFDLLIAIDALATRHIHRLNRVIQITDTGLSPGAGIGNYRKRITQEYLGIPVIAIGVATVVDSLSLIYDSLDKIDYDEQIKDDIAKNIAKINDHHLFLTTKEMDYSLVKLANVIADAINNVFGVMRKNDK